MKLIRLGVNVDHVATLRNARGELYPSPLAAALQAELAGADNITCHLREDRRHIRDDDLRLLKQSISIPLNLEIAATEDMVGIALATKPHSVTLVPEKRTELTTEGGLDLSQSLTVLADQIQRLKAAGILVSLFTAADTGSMQASARLGADAVELHTGDFCNGLKSARRTSEGVALLQPLIQAAELAHKLGMQVHIGHGINYHNAAWMRQIPHCEEANVGHAIVAQALFGGFTAAVRDMKALLNPQGLAI